jgi:hypothetical protein
MPTPSFAPLSSCSVRITSAALLYCVLLSAAPPVQAELRIQAGYSEAADLFSLMDNVSLWSPNGFNEPAYREYWTDTFGWTEEDQVWADRYRAYRERTYTDPGQAEQNPATASDGLFAKRSSFAESTDPLASHFIRSHPLRHAAEGGWSEIAVHEVIHYISAHQAPAQKRSLTARFLSECPAQIATGFYQLLEEPLAVALGNAAFANFVQGTPLEPEESWYWMPTPSVMGRLLWDDVERLYPTDATINDGIIDQAAAYCRQLLQISEWMSPIKNSRESSGD